MGFDWFTFVAQLVNFALLLLLLRLFLYRPVLNLMEQRQEQLDRAWQDARGAEAAAREEAQRLASARAALEGERRTRLEQVEKEAAACGSGAAEAEREAARAPTPRSKVRERGALVNDLLEGAGVLVGTERLPKGVGDAELEEQAVGLSRNCWPPGLES